MTTREQIEDYLLNRLTVQERENFEQELANDPGLRSELEQMRHIVIAFEKKGEQPALDAMRRLQSEIQLKGIIDNADKKPTSVQSYRRLYLAIVSAAAVLIAGWTGMQPKYTSTQLYAEYFTNDRYELAPSRGADELQEDSILYSAIAIADKGQIDKAIQMLKSIANDDNAQLQDAAKWNMALIYLRNNNRDEANAILRALIEDPSAYSEKAKKLLEKMEKRKWF